MKQSSKTKTACRGLWASILSAQLFLLPASASALCSDEGRPLLAADMVACFAPANARGVGGTRPSPRLLLHIPFAYDSDRLLSGAQGPVRELGKAFTRMLTMFPETAFVIEGHTDLRGNETYNLDLSRRRAHRVAAALVRDHEIPRERLAIQAVGEMRPLKRGYTEADHASNRRVEIVRVDTQRLAALLAQGEAEALTSYPLTASTPSYRALVLETGVFYEDPESRPRILPEGAILRSGDGYRVYFEPEQSCYVYIVQIGASGQIYRLFPNPNYGTRENYVAAHTARWIPEDEWFYLDQTKGEEAIYFIATRTPGKDIEQIFSPKKQLILDIDLRRDRTSTRGVEGIRASKHAPKPDRPPRLPSVEEIPQQGFEFAQRFSFRHE